MGSGKLGFPATHCDRMYGDAFYFPRSFFLPVNAATMQTQRRCCTAWACCQSCSSTCVTPAWPSKRFSSYVASSHPCSMATSPLMTSAGAVRLQVNGRRPPVSLFFDYNVCVFRLGLFLVYTLPCPDSVRTENSVMGGDDLLTGSFFHSQITLHFAQCRMFWHALSFTSSEFQSS